MISDVALCQIAMDTYTRSPDIVGAGDDQNTQATITDVGDVRVIAPRGSKVARDWLIDLLAVPVLGHPVMQTAAMGYLHAGVNHAELAIDAAVWAAVEGRQWMAVGHSLGGGIALDLAVSFKLRGRPPVRVRTFGALRIGLKDYIAASQGLDIREYKNGNDPVPQLPTFLLHARPPVDVGETHIFDPAGCHFGSAYLATLHAYPPANVDT